MRWHSNWINFTATRGEFVALRGASRAVVFVARARRHRARERVDAAALDVDHGDGGHPHLCVLEQPIAKRTAGVILARGAERATNVVAARVARGDALRKRLQRRIDRDVDREADIDLRAADVDPIRTAASARRGRRRVIAGGRV